MIITRFQKNKMFVKSAQFDLGRAEGSLLLSSFIEDKT
jgi:hypothetical protein